MSVEEHSHEQVVLVVGHVRERLGGEGAPRVVAIDGRSAAGKSTLAAAVAESLEQAGLRTVVIDGDDFYTGGSPEWWDSRSAQENAEHVIDWSAQRLVLEQLRRGERATWHAFDWDDPAWDAEEAPRAVVPTVIELADVVVLEGVYSARPELQDLLGLTVLVLAPDDVRAARLRRREGFDPAWEQRWSAAEDHYFSQIMVPDRFDAVVGTA